MKHIAFAPPGRAVRKLRFRLRATAYEADGRVFIRQHGQRHVLKGQPMTATDRSESRPATDDVSPGPLAPDQIQRWAALIADGACELPQELPVPDRHRLINEIRRQLRARLITLVARAIAQDLYRRERRQLDALAGAVGGDRPRTRKHGGAYRDPS